MQLFIQIFLLAVTINITAQNLIPNPSFEFANPDTAIKINWDNNFMCLDWISPTSGSPDYLTSNRAGSFSVPNNRFGTQTPHTGNAYAGMYFFTKPDYEYLQIKLVQPLIKNNYYCLSLFISAPNKEYYTTNEIDFALTKTKTFVKNWYMLKDIPYQKIIAKNDFFKINGWNKISGLYKANGDEEYLIIGLFNNTYSHATSRNIKTIKYEKLYFYMDDFSLVQIADTLECKCNIIEFYENELNDFSQAIGKPLVLKNINFETNKIQLHQNSITELKKLAVYMKQHPSFKIEITGHTDNLGKESDNMALSKGRAKTVADLLIKEGVSLKKVIYKGLGSKVPIKPNDTEENKLQNRRVEVLILK